MKSMSTPWPASCRDWRTCEPADVVPLVEAEVRAYRDELWWDVADSWSVIEPARAAGQLPGVVSCDDEGRPTGWAAYLPHEGHLQVMSVVARDETTAARLVDAIVGSADARACRSTIFCVRDATPGLRQVLASRGFVGETYRYLSRPLSRLDKPQVEVFDGWSGHEDAMAALCADAYRDTSGIRAFAPDGTMPEWRRYIRTLVGGTGTGWFLPECSFVRPEPARNLPVGEPGLQAGVLVSDLGTSTAHIAQVAVHPSARGRGLGRAIIATALGNAQRFHERVTLLVAASNAPACRLYESMGFTDRACFVTARRDLA